MEQQHHIYDITVPLSPSLVVYPGDAPIKITSASQLAKGDAVNTSHIEMGSHSGTHLDVPRHLFAEGDTTDALDLATLIGPVRVVMVPSQNHITADLLRALDFTTTHRILFKTRNSHLWARSEFQPDYVALTASAAYYLIEQGIKLVGIDYLSVDAYECSDYPVHRILLGAGTLILEGLDLRAVRPGNYELIALPLRLQDGDGAPTRVLLRHLRADDFLPSV